MPILAKQMRVRTPVTDCVCSVDAISLTVLRTNQRRNGMSASRRVCRVSAQNANGGQPQVLSAGKGSNAKTNGAAKTNGSTPSNQPGQAIAPKVPGEATPKAKPKSQPPKGFNNINRFIVPEDKIDEFEAAWQEREAVMQQLPGFLGFSLQRQDGSDFTATSKWASIPEWETYSLSEVSRRSHLPWGVYQYVPAKGEGFPEDFIPFKGMDTFVNAKY